MKTKGPFSNGSHWFLPGDEVPWTSIYPFFLVHMLVFGSMAFVLAYGASEPGVLLWFGGPFAILLYVWFYVTVFGADEVRWMFINGALGIAGIHSQFAWMLGRLGKQIGDIPWYLHVIPFTYYVLYVFLIRHAFLDLFDARENPARRAAVEKIYVAISLAICAVFYLLDRR